MPLPRKDIVLHLPSSAFVTLSAAMGRANEDYFLDLDPGTLCIADMKIQEEKLVAKLLFRAEGWTVERVLFEKLFKKAVVVR